MIQISSSNQVYLHIV